MEGANRLVNPCRRLWHTKWHTRPAVFRKSFYSSDLQGMPGDGQAGSTPAASTKEGPAIARWPGLRAFRAQEARRRREANPPGPGEAGAGERVRAERSETSEDRPKAGPQLTPAASITPGTSGFQGFSYVGEVTPPNLGATAGRVRVRGLANERAEDRPKAGGRSFTPASTGGSWPHPTRTAQ